MLNCCCFSDTHFTPKNTSILSKLPWIPDQLRDGDRQRQSSAAGDIRFLFLHWTHIFHDRSTRLKCRIAVCYCTGTSTRSTQRQLRYRHTVNRCCEYWDASLSRQKAKFKLETSKEMETVSLLQYLTDMKICTQRKTKMLYCNRSYSEKSRFLYILL